LIDTRWGPLEWQEDTPKKRGRVDFGPVGIADAFVLAPANFIRRFVVMAAAR
jgi:hypothetical protein